MKRLLTLLLIACSTIATIHAQQRAKNQPQTTPVHVKELFNNIIENWGNPSDEVYSVNKNPNTSLIESSVRITYFVTGMYSADKPSLTLNDISERCAMPVGDVSAQLFSMELKGLVRQGAGGRYCL